MANNRIDWEEHRRGKRIIWLVFLIAVVPWFVAIFILVANGQTPDPSPRDYDDACPPDRPNQRVVTDFTAPVQCTLMICIGQLVCSSDGNACSRVSADCNRCTTPPTYRVCLSDEELREAMGKAAQETRK